MKCGVKNVGMKMGRNLARAKHQAGAAKPAKNFNFGKPAGKLPSMPAVKKGK